MSSSSNRASIRAGNRAPDARHALTARTLMISIATGAALTLHAWARAETASDPGANTLNIAAVGLNTAAVGIAEKDKTARPKPQNASSLRCWQFGRLLFEENNLEPAPETLASARAWARTRPGDPSTTARTPNGAVHLIQLGDALCLFTDKGKDG